MQAKITKRNVDALRPGQYIADPEVRGLVARCLPSGAISYGFRYRDQARKQRWLPLGLHGQITPDQARDLAKKRAGEVADNRDPVGERSASQAAAAKTDRGVYAGLLYERAARYPAKDKQFAPTTLGNAIRRFETYAGDRYQLDSQLLWHDLTAVAPPQAVNSVDQARTNVDFFVCLLYGSATTAFLGIGVTAVGDANIRSGLAVLMGVLIAIVSYRLAVIATDDWDAAVRAVVDHGRMGVATAFGLTIPVNLTDERYMWRAVNTLVRRHYSYSESRDIPAILQRFRGSDPMDGNGLNSRDIPSTIVRHAVPDMQPSAGDGDT